MSLGQLWSRRSARTVRRCRDRDLVGDVNPLVVIRDYAIAPDSVLTVLAAEQRWLVEEEGRGSMPGDTYVDKARESLRRALERD